MQKLPFLLSIFSLLVSTPTRAAAQMSPPEVNSWLEKCISAKPRRIQPYSVQSSKLRLNVRVPAKHYLIWKDPFKRRDGDLTIVNQERYISQQCSEELSALHGVPIWGSRYGVLLIYEGPPRDEYKFVSSGSGGRFALSIVSKVSIKGSEAVIYGSGRTYVTTILHTITKSKITLESWSHPQIIIEETVKHLSFF